jgi:hypothetical protein
MSTKKRPNAFSTERELMSLQEIPNVGPSIAEGLERAGIKRPSHLKGTDPYVLYPPCADERACATIPVSSTRSFPRCGTWKAVPCNPGGTLRPSVAKTSCVMEGRWQPARSGRASPWRGGPQPGPVNRNHEQQLRPFDFTSPGCEPITSRRPGSTPPTDLRLVNSDRPSAL